MVEHLSRMDKEENDWFSNSFCIAEDRNLVPDFMVLLSVMAEVTAEVQS